MSQCHVCNSTEFKTKFVSEIFKIKEQFYIVEQIPAQVCSRCGETIFSRETTEKIRRMLHGEAQPLKSVKVDVFSY